MRSLKWFSLLRPMDALLSIVYPCECRICENFVPSHKSASVCEACWGSITRIEDPLCSKCGLPFASELALTYSPEHLCSDCHFDTYSFTRARSYGVYKAALKEAIHLFKFEKRKNLGARLAQLLYETLVAHFTELDIDLIVPVPLHKKRLKERGFNQCEILARGLGKRSRIPTSANNLVKVKDTQPQTGLTDKQRAKNVKNAFRVKNPKLFSDKGILLVDDVFTTGATLNECSRTLRKAGAQKVYVLTLARVVRI